MPEVQYMCIDKCNTCATLYACLEHDGHKLYNALWTVALATFLPAISVCPEDTTHTGQTGPAHTELTHLVMTESAIKSSTSTKQLVLQKLQGAFRCPEPCCIGYSALCISYEKSHLMPQQEAVHDLHPCQQLLCQSPQAAQQAGQRQLQYQLPHQLPHQPVLQPQMLQSAKSQEGGSLT